MSEYEIPRETVKLPVGLKNIGRPYRRGDEYMHMFENGVTAEEEAYPIPLPIAPDEYERERRRVANGLAKARDRFNRTKPNRADHLLHRVHSQPGVMYVVILKKYNDTQGGEE